MGKAWREGQQVALSPRHISSIAEKTNAEKFGAMRIMVDLPPIKEDPGATIMSAQSSPCHSEKALSSRKSEKTDNVSAPAIHQYISTVTSSFSFEQSAGERENTTADDRQQQAATLRSVGYTQMPKEEGSGSSSGESGRFVTKATVIGGYGE